MEKIRQELRRIKPWILVLSYAAILSLVVLNFDRIMGFLHLMLVNLNTLFYGIIMAFVLNLPMVRVEHFIKKYFPKDKFIYKHARGFSICAAIIFVCLVFGIVLMVVIPELMTSFFRLVSNAGNYFNEFMANIVNLLNRFHIDEGIINDIKAFDFDSLLKLFGFDYSKILQQITDIVLDTGTQAIWQFVNFGSYLFYLFMGFMVSLYMLGSKEKLINQMKKMVIALFPKKIADEILRMADISNGIFSDFVGGKLVESVVVGVLVYVLMLVCQLPYAILIAVMCGISTIIPVIGSLVATIIACFILLTINPLYAIVFFIIYQIVQNVDGNFIYPKFIGKGLGLPPIWIVVSVLFFSGVFGAYGLGVIGMVIAVPLTACIYTFGSEYINYRIRKKSDNPEE